MTAKTNTLRTWTTKELFDARARLRDTLAKFDRDDVIQAVRDLDQVSNELTRRYQEDDAYVDRCEAIEFNRCGIR